MFWGREGACVRACVRAYPRPPACHLFQEPNAAPDQTCRWRLNPLSKREKIESQ